MSNNPADNDRLDNDATDELPILLETAVLDPAEHRVHPLVSVAGDDDTGEYTMRYATLGHDVEAQLGAGAAALRRDVEEREARIAALEQNFAALAGRSADLERRLAEKDAAIAKLNGTVATQRELLDERTAAEQRLATELADRDAQFSRVLDELDRARREAETDRGALAAERDALAAERDAHRATADELAASRVKERERTAAAVEPAERQRLHEEIATLGAYIATRRAWWDELEARAAAAAERVAELERELAHRASRQRRAEELAERETARAAELRMELVERSRLLEAAERALRGERDTHAGAVNVDAIRAEVADAAATAAALRRELAETDRQLAEERSAAERREKALADEHAAALTAAREAALAEAQAAAAAERAAALAEARANVLAEREAAFAEGRMAGKAETAAEELEQLRRQLAETRAHLEEQRADTARLEHALLDKDRALEARDERIATLQAELADKAGALQHLRALDVSLQGLDSRMSERLARADAMPETAPALVCLTSEQPRQYLLSKKTMTIGRSSQSDIQIVTHFVSREHARITVGRNSVVIEDLGSTNGVFVNSIRIDKQELRHSDLVTVGETQFRFLGSMAH